MNTINLDNYEAFLLDYLEGNLAEELCSELKLFSIKHPELDIDLNDQNLPFFKAEKLEADFKIHLKKTPLNFPGEEVLNYIENNLSEAERKAFEVKLLNNKELATDLAVFKKTLLQADESVVFENKPALSKTEDDFVLNNQVLAYFENTLAASEKITFELELKTNLALQKELFLFSKTKLQNNMLVVYPDKEELKKESRIIALFSLRTVSAMAAAILLLFGLSFVFTYYNQKLDTQSFAKNGKPKKDPDTRQVLNPSESSVNNLEPTLQTTAPLAGANKNGSGKSKKTQPVLGVDPQVPVAANKEPVNVSPSIDKKPVEPEQKLIEENKLPDQLVENTNPVTVDQSDTKQAVAFVLEESEDNEGDETGEPKNGFWKKAVKLAKRANRLGVKSVDGVEKPNSNFSLSFNAFSVERH